MTILIYLPQIELSMSYPPAVRTLGIPGVRTVVVDGFRDFTGLDATRLELGGGRAFAGVELVEVALKVSLVRELGGSGVVRLPRRNAGRGRSASYLVAGSTLVEAALGRARRSGPQRRVG
jgi:hypothetical protein